MAAPIGGRLGMTQGRGGRIDVQPDLTVEGFPGVYALGDFANIPTRDEHGLPQLGSVAQQSGDWAARNILADTAGKGRQSFHYHDKGIMAMIGRKAAVAAVGEHRHELHGGSRSPHGSVCTRSSSRRARPRRRVPRLGRLLLLRPRQPQVLDPRRSTPLHRLGGGAASRPASAARA